MLSKNLKRSGKAFAVLGAVVAMGFCAQSRAALLLGENYSGTLGAAGSQSGADAGATYNIFNTGAPAPATSNGTLPFTSGQGDAGYGINHNFFGEGATLNISYDVSFPNVPPNRFFVAELGAATPIQNSTDFGNYYNSKNTGTNGLVVFTAGSGAVGGDYYQVQNNNNTVGGVKNVASPAPTYVAGDLYNVSVQYTQATGDYSATLTDTTSGTALGTLTGTANVTPTADYIAIGAHNTNVTLSNFSISNSVPEPASLGLLAMSAIGLVSRRRRKN